MYAPACNSTFIVRAQDRSGQFIDPYHHFLFLSLFLRSCRTVVGFCPVLPAAAPKRNHCVALWLPGKSMGLFVLGAARRMRRPVPHRHVGIAARWAQRLEWLLKEDRVFTFRLTLLNWNPLQWWLRKFSCYDGVHTFRSFDNMQLRCRHWWVPSVREKQMEKAVIEGHWDGDTGREKDGIEGEKGTRVKVSALRVEGRICYRKIPIL